MKTIKFKPKKSNVNNKLLTLEKQNNILTPKEVADELSLM